jgi:hypothetical protein
MELNNKTALKLLRSKMEEALNGIAEELGVEFTVGNCRYDPNGEDCRFKLEVVKAGLGDPVERKAKQEYIELVKYGMLGGFKDEHLGREFENRGRTFTLVGIKPRAKKQRLLGKCSDGSGLFRFNEDFVARQLDCEQSPVVSKASLLDVSDDEVRH